jgi:hypothetical protein
MDTKLYSIGCLFLWLVTAGTLQAQSKNTANAAAIAQDSTSSPRFPGGMKEFYTFLHDNFVIPEEAINANVNANLIASFVIEPDGAIAGIKILRDQGYGTAEETTRVLLLSPKWFPAIQNGAKIAQTVTIPIPISSATSKKIVEKEDASAALTEIPSYPGGEDEFYRFVHKNFELPREAFKIDGQISVSMVVEIDGSLSEIKVLNDLGFGSGDEAIRVMSMTPKWIPGKRNGVAVRTPCSLVVYYNYNVPNSSYAARTKGKNTSTKARVTHVNYDRPNVNFSPFIRKDPYTGKPTK